MAHILFLSLFFVKSNLFIVGVALYSLVHNAETDHGICWSIS